MAEYEKKVRDILQQHVTYCIYMTTQLNLKGFLRKEKQSIIAGLTNDGI